MDGLPTTIRLLDPPLHEFLPDRTELAVRVAVAKATGGADPVDERLLAAVERLHENNPMLGLRGVRLGLRMPGLFSLQIRAIAEACVELRKQGKDPQPEIMVPLVGSQRELQLVRDEAESILKEIAEETGEDLDFAIGCMIELPRAALTSARIAEEADFFSFGTNDLTQLTYGFSRDDIGKFLGAYQEKKILERDPFQSLDTTGVGQLVQIAAQKGRATRPTLKLGVCGEHGGDPSSIHFFQKVGLNYVSMSPYRVPVARLAAAQAAMSVKVGD